MFAQNHFAHQLTVVPSRLDFVSMKGLKTEGESCQHLDPIFFSFVLKPGVYCRTKIV